MKYELVLFDMDGTLLDTSNSIAMTVNSTMKELGLKTYSVNDCVKFAGGGVTGLTKNILEKVILTRSYFLKQLENTTISTLTTKLSLTKKFPKYLTFWKKIK